jgi:hypothetical protein
MKVPLQHFIKKHIIYIFSVQDPNNGVAFVPESETIPAWSGEWPGFLLVG